MGIYCKPSVLFQDSYLLVLTQLLCWVTTKGFRVFGPSDPVVVAPGREAILPCSVSPAMSVENMEELRWFRTRFSEAVFVYRDQEEQKEEQMIEYSLRTSLVKDQFHEGKAAVRIQNVQESDSGIHVCHFKQGVLYEEAILELKVAAMGSTPEVYIKGPEDGGVCVVCMTSGWYPEPQVHWRDSTGEDLPASSETLHEDAEGLFSTETSLVLRDSSVRNVACSIFNPVLGQEKAIAIVIPEPFFPQASPWKAAFIVILTMMGLLVSGTSYLLIREHSGRLKLQQEWSHFQLEKDELQTIKEDALRTASALREELDRRKATYNRAWRKAQLYAGTFTLDPASAHPTLVISQDRMRVTRKDTNELFRVLSIDLFSVLGTKGISSGRYYWEVKLANGEGSKWSLGVCREVVERKDFYFESPEKGFWTVGQSSCGYFAYVERGRASLSIRQAPQSVGVFVDYDEGEISFYNMSDMSHIFSYEASFSGTLLPYFRLKSGNVSMTVSTMACVSEGQEGEEGEKGEEQEEGKEGEECQLLSHARDTLFP
ncbi:butyrophilin-like 5 isoform X2 [Rattus norvegicus]|uniref:butyrophilin-like 5 isoform X2 n=1 Tax=Rattus norvegicus TaxID=10116 RepID=UPI002FD8376D